MPVCKKGDESRGRKYWFYLYCWTMCRHAQKKVPFLVVFFPLLNIFANDAAREGFSATIKAVFIVQLTFVKPKLPTNYNISV